MVKICCRIRDLDPKNPIGKDLLPQKTIKKRFVVELSSNPSTPKKNPIGKDLLSNKDLYSNLAYTNKKPNCCLEVAKKPKWCLKLTKKPN